MQDGAGSGESTIGSLSYLRSAPKCIRARLARKGELRAYSNERSSGQVIKLDFVDKTGAITMTAFGERAETLARLEEGKMYTIEKVRVQRVRRPSKFDTVRNESELVCEWTTDVRASEERAEDADVPRHVYNLEDDIAGLRDRPKDDFVDVIGVVYVTEGVETTSNGHRVRALELADESGSISIRFWNDDAERSEYSVGDVLAFRRVRVCDYGNVSLSVCRTSGIDVDPVTARTEALRTWWAERGDAPILSLTSSMPRAKRARGEDDWE